MENEQAQFTQLSGWQHFANDSDEILAPKESTNQPTE